MPSLDDYINSFGGFTTLSDDEEYTPPKDETVDTPTYQIPSGEYINAEQ